MKEITENRVLSACENFAENKETPDDREIIMGYIVYLEGQIVTIERDRLMDDCLADTAFDAMREN